MEYIINRNEWDNSDHKVRINKRKFPAASSREWLPEKADRIGEAIAQGKKTPQEKSGGVGSLHIYDRYYLITPISRNKVKHFFFKERGWVQAANTKGRLGYVLIRSFRFVLIPVAILLVLAAVSLSLYLNTGIAPIYQPQYIADQTGITSNRNDPTVEIGSYSAYQSVPDYTWKAGETHQEIKLVLPANVTVKDKYGRDQSYKNPIDAAPHIYVDLNKDGEFTEDECLYNPMTLDDEGNITDIGKLLQAGNEITSVDLTSPLDAGEYDAQVLWTGITSDTHEMANPMTFRFHLTVQ